MASTPRLRNGLASVRITICLAAASLVLAACTVSGPGSLGDTGSVKPVASQPVPAASVAVASPQGSPAETAAANVTDLVTRAPVKVTMLLPLSGAPHVAALAKGLKQAGELALFELDNPAVQLSVKDDKGTQDGARIAAEEAVKEGAELILGPLLSRAVAGAAPVARNAGIPVVGFSNDPQVAGNGVYLLSFLPRPEIERVMTFATSQSRKRFAGLFSSDAHGQMLEEAFRSAISRNGGTLVAREAVAADSTSVVEPVQRLAEAIKKAEESGAPVDALIIPGGQEAIAQVMPVLATTGIDVSKLKLIGTGGWDLPGGARDNALAGSWYAGPDPRGWREFAERFAKSYGTPPPRLATLAYDAVGLAVALSSNAQRARYTSSNLTRPSGFPGTDGQFRLMPGGLSERALAVLELQKNGVSVIEPAPGSLANAQLTSATKLD